MYLFIVFVISFCIGYLGASVYTKMREKSKSCSGDCQQGRKDCDC